LQTKTSNLAKGSFLKKTIIISIASLVIILFAGATYKILQSSSTDKDYYDAFNRNYKIFNVEMPEQLTFAGEPVPIDKYYVRESLERELIVNTYWNSNTLLLFKRAFRFFPIIEPIFKQYGIPDDLKYVVLIESNLENVVSPAGAAGYWQFMKNTATSYGLEISDEVDERLNIEKATVAACKYFSNAYKVYKNWTLAAASYNIGVGGLSEHLKTQKIYNYYDLHLNKETIRYVYRIIAVKTIFQNPSKYGYYIRLKDLYPPIPTQIITIDSAVSDISQFAIDNKVNFRVIKDLNPWILKNSLKNTAKKRYEIKIPVNSCIKYDSLINKVKNYYRLFNDTLGVESIK
jgi:hypothetical protein